MGLLCVQRRFLSGGCLLSLLWPGTPGVENIADHGTIGPKKYFMLAERKKGRRKRGKERKKRRERKKKEGKKKNKKKK